MADRKREDPATLGDLQDLAEQMKGGITEALKSTLGKVIPGPAPNDPPAGDPPASDPPAGDPPAAPKHDFGFGGRWWGGS